jgi:hypothetical protein
VRRGPLGAHRSRRDPSKDKSDPARWLRTAVIITTNRHWPRRRGPRPNPLILPRDRVEAWLDPTRTKPDQIYQVLDGIVLEPLTVRPGFQPGHPRGHRRPAIIEPLSELLDEPLQLTLTAGAA